MNKSIRNFQFEGRLSLNRISKIDRSNFLLNGIFVHLAPRRLSTGARDIYLLSSRPYPPYNIATTKKPALAGLVLLTTTH